MRYFITYKLSTENRTSGAQICCEGSPKTSYRLQFLSKPIIQSFRRACCFAPPSSSWLRLRTWTTLWLCWSCNGLGEFQLWYWVWPRELACVTLYLLHLISAKHSTISEKPPLLRRRRIPRLFDDIACSVEDLNDTVNAPSLPAQSRIKHVLLMLRDTL